MMFRCPLFLFLLLSLAAYTRAADPLHLQLPHDTLTFLEIDPAAAGPTRTADQSAILDLGVQALQSTGILSRQASEAGDFISLLGIAGNHHSCFALLDADLAATPNNDLECRSVQLAWIIDTAGHPRDMVDRLTRLLSHLSTRTTARQEVRQTPETHKEYVYFHDASWPDWLSLAWTQRENNFILTLGDGAMEHFLAERPVGGVPWLQTVGQVDNAASKTGIKGETLARLYVAARAFREHFPAPMGRTILGRLFQNLDLTTADTALFTARQQDRQIFLDNATLAPDGRLTDTPWTFPATPAQLKLLPPDATAYLSLKVDWPKLYNRIIALIDAVVPTSEPLGNVINRFAAQHNVNIENDILKHLSPQILIHDFPQHPLRIPLMVTVVGGLESAGGKDARLALSRLMTSLAQTLDHHAHAPADSDFTHLRLRTDKDDVSYLQFGLVGPAWIWVNDRWLISWSPGAVRANLPVLAR